MSRVIAHSGFAKRSDNSVFTPLKVVKILDPSKRR